LAPIPFIASPEYFPNIKKTAIYAPPFIINYYQI
jgi:hypothetical protein